MSASSALDNAINQLQLIFPTLALPRPSRTTTTLADSLTVSLSKFSTSAMPYPCPMPSTDSAPSIRCGSSSTSRNTSTNALSCKRVQTMRPSSRRRNASMNNNPPEFCARRILPSLVERNRREIWSMMFGDGKKRRIIHTRNTFSSLIDIAYAVLLGIFGKVGYFGYMLMIKLLNWGQFIEIFIHLISSHRYYSFIQYLRRIYINRNLHSLFHSFAFLVSFCGWVINVK